MGDSAASTGFPKSVHMFRISNHSFCCCSLNGLFKKQPSISVRNVSYFSGDMNDLLKIFFFFLISSAASSRLVSRFLIRSLSRKSGNLLWSAGN